MVGGPNTRSATALTVRNRRRGALALRRLPLKGGRGLKRADPFYKSRRWEKLRAAALRRDGYLCQVSRRYGKRAEATTVHHIFPREEFPEFQWEPWNLISLAGDVHDTMHDRTTGALTEKGRELLRRTARRRGMDVPEGYK